MGNYMACASLPSAQIKAMSRLDPCRTVKVMHPSGMVQEFRRPVVVAELMLENPQHFVWESASVHAKKRTPALPADAKLQAGHLYYLLPRPELSSKADTVNRNPKFAQAVDLESLCKSDRALDPVEITQKGSVTQVTVSPEYVDKVMMMHDGGDLFEGGDSCCDNSELEMAYRRHVMSRSCSWKPKLETVEEMGL